MLPPPSPPRPVFDSPNPFASLQQVEEALPPPSPQRDIFGDLEELVPLRDLLLEDDEVLAEGALFPEGAILPPMAELVPIRDWQFYREERLRAAAPPVPQNQQPPRVLGDAAPQGDAERALLRGAVPELPRPADEESDDEDQRRERADQQERDWAEQQHQEAIRIQREIEAEERDAAWAHEERMREQELAAQRNASRSRSPSPSQARSRSRSMSPSPPPEQVELPPPESDSLAWKNYWRSRRQREAQYLEHGHVVIIDDSDPNSDSESSDSQSVAGDTPAPALKEVFDFAAPPLSDGAWNSSAHVSKLIKDGFDIQVDINRRGKAPRVLQLDAPHEKAYIAQLLKDGVLETGPVSFSVPHFFIYKPGKTRLIFDGTKLNAACKKPPRFNMKSHKTIARLVLTNSWHASDDLKNMFFSVPLSDRCKEFFGIRTSMGTFRYTKLPFGFSWSPFIAHVCVDEICKRALEAGFQVTHYLDDFHYFGKTRGECKAAQDFVRNLLLQAGWRINFTKHQPLSTRFVALGIEYDLVQNTSRVPPSTLASLRKDAESLAQEGTVVSKRVLAAFIGSLVFYNNAAPGFISQLGPVLRYLNTRPPAWTSRSCFTDFFPLLDKALAKIERVGWFPIVGMTQKPVHVFTDATPTQLGMVFPSFTASMPTPKATIYRTEALAVSWALDQDALPRCVVLRIDNLALVYAIKKGRSNIKEANDVCKKIFSLRLQGYQIAAKWISTLVNPADQLSRIVTSGPEFFVSPMLAMGA